jgi:hypothetical protein
MWWELVTWSNAHGRLWEGLLAMWLLSFFLDVSCVYFLSFFFFFETIVFVHDFCLYGFKLKMWPKLFMHLVVAQGSISVQRPQREVGVFYKQTPTNHSSDLQNTPCAHHFAPKTPVTISSPRSWIAGVAPLAPIQLSLAGVVPPLGCCGPPRWWHEHDSLAKTIMNPSMGFRFGWAGSRFWVA